MRASQSEKFDDLIVITTERITDIEPKIGAFSVDESAGTVGRVSVFLPVLWWIGKRGQGTEIVIVCDSVAVYGNVLSSQLR